MIENELVEQLKNFDIPEFRLTINKQNLRWLLRNFGIRNKDKPMFNETMQLIKDALKKY